MNMRPPTSIRPINVDRDAPFAEQIAFIAVQLASVAINRVEIPALIAEWVTSEAQLSALKAKRVHGRSLSDAEEAEQDRLERRFAATLKAFLNDSMLDGIGLAFSRDPEGPAIRIQWKDSDHDVSTATSADLAIAP